MKKRILFYIFILQSIFVFSQEFIYQGKLSRVDSSGYYHIYLSPDVTSKLNYKFSDIRLYDNKNNEVPYVRPSEDEVYNTAKRRQLSIIQKDHKLLKKHTYLLVHNVQLNKINNFVLYIDNPMNAEAWINISGSDDMRTWTILKNNTRYMPEFSDSSTTEIRIRDLPESKYKYYRLFIFDHNKTVFSVHKVLNYDIKPNNRKFVELVSPTFVQDDTTEVHRTILKLNFEEAQYVDKIQFFVKEPNNYLRKSEIVKKDSTSGKRIRLKFYDQNQKDFYLCSDSSNILLLSRYYVKDLFLIIDNNNDIPLQFSQVKAYQNKEFLVAYLKKNTDYKVSFGNKNLPPPIYDLKFFKNQIPSDCPEVTVGEISKETDSNKESKVIAVKPAYLWIAFGIVILILAGISFKMFRFKNLDSSDFEL